MPRWIERDLAPVMDAGTKSDGSQPLFDVLAAAPGGMTMSFVATSGASRTSPLPE